MDHNTLEEIYQDLELCDEPEKYSEHYQRFIKEASGFALCQRGRPENDRGLCQ